MVNGVRLEVWVEVEQVKAVVNEGVVVKAVMVRVEVRKDWWDRVVVKVETGLNG